MNKALIIFKALSDKNRIRILKMLEQKPLCVCEMTHILGLAASTTSKHLSILKDAQLIFEQKENKWVNYHLNNATQNTFIKETLLLIKSWLNDDEMIQMDRVKADKVNRIDICKS
ncbi:ArsR/SmtB family transcription factor [bacterium]